MRRNRNVYANAQTAPHRNCNCCNKDRNGHVRTENGQRNARTNQNTPVETGHYDAGASLSLSYDDGMHAVNNFAAANSQFTFGQDNYYVQPFEESTPENETLNEKPIAESTPENSNIINTPKKTPPPNTFLPPVNETPPKLPNLPGNQPPQRMPVMPGEDAPQEMPVEPGDEPPIPMQQEDDDASFAADLTAILQGQKQYDAATKQVMPTDRRDRNSEPSGNRNPSPVADNFGNNEHAIFDKIAQSMKLANAYDLGTVALEQRFDAFDESADDGAKKKVNP